jgi:hypothetical protein
MSKKLPDEVPILSSVYIWVHLPAYASHGRRVCVQFL